MRLYDLRVTVERIEGRSVCGLEVGDYFELTESSRVRIPEGRTSASTRSSRCCRSSRRSSAGSPTRTGSSGTTSSAARPRGAGRHAHRADRRARAPHRGADLSAFELGLGLQSDKTVEQYERIARRAEAAGFDVALRLPRPLLPARVLPAATCSRVDRARPTRPSGAECADSPPGRARRSGRVARSRLARPRLPRARAGSWLDRLGLEDERPLTRLREAVDVTRRPPRRRHDRLRRRALHARPRRRPRVSSRSGRTLPLLLGTWRPRAAAYARTVAGRGEDRRLREPGHGAAHALVARADGPRIVVGCGHRRRRRRRRRAGARRARRSACISTSSARLDPTLEGPAAHRCEKFALAGTPAEVTRQAAGPSTRPAYARVEFGDPQGRAAERPRAPCDRVLPALRVTG